MNSRTRLDLWGPGLALAILLTSYLPPAWAQPESPVPFNWENALAKSAQDQEAKQEEELKSREAEGRTGGAPDCGVAESPMRVQVTFRKQGLPELDPPVAELAIAPRATYHTTDVVQRLFGRTNTKGYLHLETLEQGRIIPVACAEVARGGQRTITSATSDDRAPGCGVAAEPIPGNHGAACRDGCMAAPDSLCRPELVGVQVHPCEPWELGRVRVADYDYDGRRLTARLWSPCHPGQVRLWRGQPVRGARPLATWRADPGSWAATEVAVEVSPYTLGGALLEGRRQSQVYLTWSGVDPGTVQTDGGWIWPGGAPETRRGDGLPGWQAPGAGAWRKDLTAVGAHLGARGGEVRDFRVLGDMTETHPVRQALDQVAEAGCGIAGSYATMAVRSLSDGSLSRILMDAVTYVRSVSPRPPEEERGPEGRDYPAGELKSWFLGRVTGVSPGSAIRPPEARAVGVLLDTVPAECFKAAHDALREACYALGSECTGDAP